MAERAYVVMEFLISLAGLDTDIPPRIQPKESVLRAGGQLRAIEMIPAVALLPLLFDASLSYISAPFSAVCTRDEDLSSGEWELGADIQHLLRPRSLQLEGSGHRSAARLLAKMSDPPCTLTIEVPKETHAIAVSLNNIPVGAACPLSLWIHEEVSKEKTWSLNLCDREKRRLLALYPEVYPHRVTLRWKSTAWENRDGDTVRSRTAPLDVEIVATAVGRGSVCEEETRVLCWKIMKESLCVSEELACDGLLNCPLPGNDESESMCPQQQSGDLKGSLSRGWDIVADHLRQMMAVRVGDREAVTSTSNWSPRRNAGGSHGATKTPGGFQEGSEEAGKEAEGGRVEGLGIGAIFSRLGPWTSVLLCMLACGFLLLLCGLWECCCRSRVPTHSLSPRGSLAATGTQQTTTTTVFIISSSTSPPPQYEELEQPPDYKELFPVRAKSTAV